MPGARGDELLLKQSNMASPEVFTTIAGLRPTSISISSETVDTTHKGSAGWRELLTGGGITSCSISAGGVWLGNNSVQEALQALALTKALVYFQIADDDQILEALFQVASFERGGEHNTEVNFTVTLESSGPITIT
jgi:TP901-1 family phage major tail protein